MRKKKRRRGEKLKTGMAKKKRKEMINKINTHKNSDKQGVKNNRKEHTKKEKGEKKKWRREEIISWIERLWGKEHKRRSQKR
jgi:hypothetical protein